MCNCHHRAFLEPLREPKLKPCIYEIILSEFFLPCPWAATVLRPVSRTVPTSGTSDNGRHTACVQGAAMSYVSKLPCSLGVSAGPLHAHSTFYCSNPSRVVFTFWVIQIMPLWAWYASPCFYSFCVYALKWNCRIIWWLSVPEDPTCSSPSDGIILCFHRQGMWFSFLQLLPTSVSSSLMITTTTIAILAGGKRFGVAFLGWIASDGEHLLMCVLTMCLWQLHDIVHWTNIHLKFYLT